VSREKPKPKDHLPCKPSPNMWGMEKSSKRRSLENEARLAVDIGGKATPGSGNQHWPMGKGDIAHPGVMVEGKETSGSRLSVGVDVVGKVYREASNVGKEPAIILLVYGLPDPLPKEWVCITKGFFAELLE
jgi:hypothetical protein